MSLRNTRHEYAALSSHLPISSSNCTPDSGTSVGDGEARAVPPLPQRSLAEGCVAPGGGSHKEIAAAGHEIRVPQEQGRGTKWVAKYPVSTLMRVQLGHYNATKE